MLRKKRQWNHIKYSTKTTKGRKRVEKKNRNKDRDSKPKLLKTKILDINLTISVISFHAGGLNAPIKRQIARVDQKNSAKLHVLYKKLTLNIKTYLSQK